MAIVRKLTVMQEKGIATVILPIKTTITVTKESLTTTKCTVGTSYSISPQFHLSKLEGVIISLPCPPVYTISIR